MKSSEEQFIPDTKHWLWQVLPPLSLLVVLFATTSGTSMIFLAGIFIFPFLISVLSLVIKLIRYKQRKYYLLRPSLTIGFFMILVLVANWSYSAALEQLEASARLIHEQCNQATICPRQPAGWQNDDNRLTRSDLGRWHTYQAYYVYQEQSFDIRLYQGPDIGHRIIGGVDKAFMVVIVSD